MIAAHRPAHDAVDPASQSFGSFESVDAGVDHDEDFLDDVIDGFWMDAETPNGRPYEIEILPVQSFEWRHFGRWKY